MKLAKITVLTLICFGLAACSTSRKPKVAIDSDPAVVKLAEAADSVSGTLVRLATIQAAATPPAKNKHLPDPGTFGMQGMASVDWSGPIGELVKKIAHSSDYKFRVLGNAPAIPIVITVTAQDTPLAKILRDVDFQAGERADIRVYPERKVVELRYARA